VSTPLIVGDDITVLLDGMFIARGRVRAIDKDGVIEAFPGGWRLSPDDEGMYWIRGFHGKDSEELRALIIANTLLETNTQQGEPT
jgi:hypothetical protein